MAQAVPVQVADDDDRLRAARWMDHADVKRACNWILECSAITSPTATPATKTGAKHGVWELLSSPMPSGGRVSAVPSFLRRIARTFVDLQDARHAADYDHLAEFPKATARRHIESAESALSLLATNTADPAMGRFLALLAFSSSRLPR